jgi:hypothetical protein
MWQCNYSGDVIKESQRLLIDSIAVFLAFSLTLLINAIIIFIAQNHDSEASSHSIKIEVVLTFVYAFCSYLIGKFIFLYLLSFPESSIAQYLSNGAQERTSPMILFKHFLIEHSAFAWKEFATTLFFTYFYETAKWSSYLTTLIVWWILVCLAFLFFSHFITHFVRNLSRHIRDELYEFDYYCFSFSIAYMITVAWALLFKQHSVLLARKDQFLFGWKTTSIDYCLNGTQSSSNQHFDDDYTFNSYSSPSQFGNDVELTSRFDSPVRFLTINSTDSSSNDDTHQFQDVAYSLAFILYPIGCLILISFSFLVERVVKNVYRRWKAMVAEEQAVHESGEDGLKTTENTTNVENPLFAVESQILSKTPFHISSSIGKVGSFSLKERSFSRHSSPSIDDSLQTDGRTKLAPFISFRGLLFSVLEFWLIFKG